MSKSKPRTYYRVTDEPIGTYKRTLIRGATYYILDVLHGETLGNAYTKMSAKRSCLYLNWVRNKADRLYPEGRNGNVEY